MRTKQCAACPWKLSTDPHRDIPGGYSPAKHAALVACQAPGMSGMGRPVRAMACHESPPGREDFCVGWVLNQLGPGNNIALRFRAMSGEFSKLRTEGPQHETMESMLAAGRRRRRRRG